MQDQKAQKVLKDAKETEKSMDILEHKVLKDQLDLKAHQEDKDQKEQQLIHTIHTPQATDQQATVPHTEIEKIKPLVDGLIYFK